MKVAALIKSGTLRRTMLAAAAFAACASASALPSFTLNPGDAGLAGSAFTADNLLVSDYAQLTVSGGNTSETGFLSVTGAQLGGTTTPVPGLNSTYGLYIQFSLTTSTVAVIPAGGTTFVNGVITSLNYSLYGYNGTASFTPTSTTASSPVLLGSGSLDPVETSTAQATFSGTTLTSATATTSLTFTATNAAFFDAPTPFYTMALASFTNSASQIASAGGGVYNITQGGGTINFVQSVPEPESYALMLGGLAAVGYMARRRRNS